MRLLLGTRGMALIAFKDSMGLGFRVYGLGLFCENPL